jgi:Raf kinase inhibitor-like YbhB/YbcL family protein
MKRSMGRAGAWFAGAVLAALALAAVALAAGKLLAADSPAGKEQAMGKFTLTSTDLSAGGTIAEAQVFNQFGCKGRNVSPALAWSGAPAGTQSFALLMHDPDAPTGSGWWHWIVYNIPANTTSLPAGAGDPHKQLMPAGAVQARNDYGAPGYGGPCPPPGKPHHYNFRLYALKVAKLDAPADATAALIGFSVHANEIARAELTGLYGR